MRLDFEMARLAVQSGMPAIELYRCPNGHQWRVLEAETARRSRPLIQPRCAVCGIAIARRANVKICSAPCRRMVAARRQQAYARGERFILEAQPWYRGHVEAFQEGPAPLESLDPFRQRWPAFMRDGWLRYHNQGASRP